MIINNTKPIFIQLADVIKDMIMDGKLQPDDRIPSVREIAATYEVNNNTAMRSIDSLAKDEIIYQKRGMGYFVSDKARSIIKQQQKRTLLEDMLPPLRKAVKQAGITKEELIDMLNL